MIGTIVNAAAIACGGVFGMIFKKGLPQKLSDSIMSALGLCVIYIGVSGSLKCENALCMILSIVTGVIIGEIIDIDKWVKRLGGLLGKKFSHSETSTFSKAFVTSTLLFCVGAMAIVGPLESGISKNHTTLFSKSLIDGISAAIISSTLGAGVIFSAASVFLYQGAITLLADVLSPLLSSYVINQMSATGSLIVIGLALNMLKITNLKVMNMVPAIFMPILLCMFMKP